MLENATRLAAFVATPRDTTTTTTSTSTNHKSTTTSTSTTTTSSIRTTTTKLFNKIKQQQQALLPPSCETTDNSISSVEESNSSNNSNDNNNGGGGCCVGGIGGIQPPALLEGMNNNNNVGQQQRQQQQSYCDTGSSRQEERKSIRSKAEKGSSSGKGRETVVRRLAEVLIRGSLTMIDLSQRGLISNDARLIHLAIMHNPMLTKLKLSYNNLGDQGATYVASAIRGHPSLSVLDMGFNSIGDVGCTSLASHAVTNNPILKTLYLSGNSVGTEGALHLAEAVRLPGCGLCCLHLTANKLWANGVKGLARAIAENEARAQASEACYEEHADWNHSQQQQQPNSSQHSTEKTKRTNDHNRLQELFLGGTAMGSTGCLSISNMLLTNLSLRVLDLCNNDIEDRDMALFSQSLSRNKLVPLEVLQLSFNKLTCVGVESLMNAVWGSTTLRQLRLDNNRVNDRGAQLVAVVLTSVNLEVVDLGFNLITTVGIKALMKSLAENDSLQSLTLSGNPLDTTASKAVSYALAYNTSLTALYLDHCSIGYAAQRHITAGIASNSQSALSVVTGFGIGAIAVTLGLPPALENWANEQVLSFFRLMWNETQRCASLNDCDNATATTASSPTNSNKNGSSNELRRRSIFGDNVVRIQGSKSANDVNNTQSVQLSRARPKVGPSDPATVVAAAKNAYEAIVNAGEMDFLLRTFKRDVSLQSPLAPSEEIILERTLSGTIRVPPNGNFTSSSTDPSPPAVMENGSSTNTVPKIFPQQQPQSSESNTQFFDSIRTKRNMEWLAGHARALQELAILPFNNADLWQLHQYFFSPVEATTTNSNHNCDEADSDISNRFHPMDTDCSTTSTTSSPFKRPIPSSLSRTVHGYGNVNPASSSPQDEAKEEFISSLPQLAPRPWTASPVLERKTSYRFLQDAVTVASVDVAAASERKSRRSSSSPGGRRRTVSVLNENCSSDQPASKRLKKARIAYFPRIRERLELLRSKAGQHQALILMRQLKYIETALFKGRNIYSEAVSSSESEQITASDAETILIEML